MVDGQDHHGDTIAAYSLRVNLGEYTRLGVGGTVPFVAFTSYHLDSVSRRCVDNQVQRNNTVTAIGSGEVLLIFATFCVPMIIPLEGTTNDGVESEGGQRFHIQIDSDGAVATCHILCHTYQGGVARQGRSDLKTVCLIQGIGTGGVGKDSSGGL